MSQKLLLRLIGVLVVVVILWGGATLLARMGGDSVEVDDEIAGFFDGVDATSVSSIRILRPADTIELHPDGDRWRVNGFRGDSGSVARFFLSLEQAEVAGLAATNPANHERMGVSADSARTLELVVSGSPRSLLFGDEGPRMTTVYARRPGADEVYLIEGGIRNHLIRRLDDWRNRRMLAIDTSRVARIEVRRDQDEFTLVRADTVWTFADGNEARATQVGGLLGELGGGLVASSFVADGDSLAAEPPGGTTVAYSESGEVLAEVRVGSGTNERWGMVAGDSVRYRLPRFRVDLIVPTLESVRPPEG